LPPLSGLFAALTVIVTLSGSLFTSSLFVTSSLKTRFVVAEGCGAVNVGFDDVVLLRVTEGPDV
jgi:hypothetical protein